MAKYSIETLANWNCTFNGSTLMDVQTACLLKIVKQNNEIIRKLNQINTDMASLGRDGLHTILKEFKQHIPAIRKKRLSKNKRKK